MAECGTKKLNFSLEPSGATAASASARRGARIARAAGRSRAARLNIVLWGRSDCARADIDERWWRAELCQIVHAAYGPI